jgi:hypothetical protein
VLTGASRHDLVALSSLQHLVLISNSIQSVYYWEQAMNLNPVGNTWECV